MGDTTRDTVARKGRKNVLWARSRDFLAPFVFVSQENLLRTSNELGSFLQIFLFESRKWKNFIPHEEERKISEYFLRGNREKERKEGRDLVAPDEAGMKLIKVSFKFEEGKERVVRFN